MMRIHNLRHPSRLLVLPALITLGCSDSQLVAAPVQEPALAVSSEKIVGGGGVSLSVHEAGKAEGPPIVFIHGFGANHLTWDRQMRGPLASEFRLVAYDLRGHGASDRPMDAAQYTDAALWADDLDAVIRGKGLERPVLVGWSYGGFVIADYIRKYGDGNLGGVVFLSAITKNGTAEAAGHLTDEVLAIFGDVLSADVRKGMEATRELTRMFDNPLKGAAWEIAYGSTMMLQPEIRLAMFSRLLDNDDVLSGIGVPALAVHGARDRIVRVSSSEHIAGKVPGAKLLVYEGVGHATQITAAPRLNRDLAEFVRASRGN
jgi:pimeloyl-ACP methyl ester carboxylesterase